MKNKTKKTSNIKNVFNVFFNDLKSMKKNIVVFIIIIGICILPSLYAWINIYASWDPYANTGNLPVVVVNVDEGAMLNGKNLNVGEEIVENLQKNKSIGWIFEDEWQANDGLNRGKYYALIKIPSNFTQQLLSMTTTDPKKPDIIYKENGKANAIANKITQVAMNELTKEIKANFVETVYKIALETLNPVGDKLNDNKPQIMDLQNNLTTASKDLGQLSSHIKDVSNNSKDMTKYLEDVKKDLPKIQDIIINLQGTVRSSKNLNQATREAINEISSDMNEDIMRIQNTTSTVQQLITNLKIETDINKKLEITDKMEDLYSSVDKVIKTNIKVLNTIYKFTGDNRIKDSINNFKKLQSNIDSNREDLKTLIDYINNHSTVEEINTHIDRLNDLVYKMGEIATDVSNSFYSGTVLVSNSIVDSLDLGADSIDLMLEGTQNIVPELNSLSSMLISTSKFSTVQANELNSKIQKLNTDLNKLIKDTDGFTEEMLNKIVDLMKEDPELISSFVSSPINIVEEDVYKIVPFGVGLTPFYSVLSIWIGTLLACCLLSVDVEKSEIKEGKLTYHQAHFGKMLTFYFISMIQSLIIFLGDVFILGVEPENFMVSLMFIIVTSITFTTIIFTIVSMLGNVGKAIVVVMMVFQIAGSGGIYPVETIPKIFGVLEPLWPFKYAMAGLREGISGPIRENVIRNLYSLGAFVGVFLLLTLVKRPIHKVTEKFDEIFKKAEL